MKIEKTTTGMIIREPSDDIKKKCLQYFSLDKPLREFFIYTGTDEDNNGLFGGKNDAIYISSGFAKIRDTVISNSCSKFSTITPRVGKPIKIEMNREPRSPLQIDCIKKLTTSDSPKITVELKPGTGKMEPYSRKIPTPTKQGYTLMGDLKIGDEVFNRYGEKSIITGIFENGVQPVYTVTFNDGRIAECGKEHLWTVKNHKGNNWECLSLEAIMNDPNRKFIIPSGYSVNYDKRDVDVDPWTVGCFLMKGDYEYSLLSLRSENESLPQYVADKYDYTIEKTGNKISSYIFKRKYDNTYVTYDEFFGVDLYQKLKSYIIPDDYLYGSIGMRNLLLSGIMDTVNIDNYKNDTILTLDRSINQVAQLLYSLGYNCLVDDNKLTIFGLKETYITSIEYSRDEECRCIMVDNIEHEYMTENYIVTHNTFISMYSIAKVGLKPLIVAPSTLLKNQWFENLTDTGVSKDNIATDIYDSVDKDYCVVTISSLENAMRDDWYRLKQTIDKANFGIRITDESHLHMKGLLKLDSICNIKHNWYLSATLGRSDAEEDRILNYALSDADRFIGNSTYTEYQKEYVNIYLQDIFYFPSAKLCEKYFKFGTKGLVRSTYYNMLMNYKGGKPFIDNIIYMIKLAKKIVTYGKVLILVPIITTINAVLEEIKHDSYFNDLTCSGVDGSMSIAVKRQALESKIIISTSMSMGVGVDISDLGAVINFDQYASLIVVEQCCGRLRDRGKETYYFDICDHVKYAKTVEKWGQKRRFGLPYFPGVHSEIKKLPKIMK